MKTWQKLQQQPELWATYDIRERVFETIRAFFKSQHFREVMTPTLVSIPSCEPNLEVFSTTLTTATGISRSAYFIMSPEYAIKKLLAAGVGNCFELTRAYRNREDVSMLHNPEFSILEWYRVGATYKEVMNDFEQLFLQIVGKTTLSYQGKTYDLSSPWPRLSVAEAFLNYCGIDTETLLSFEKLSAAAASRGYAVSSTTNWDELFSQIFFNEIEPKLRDSGRPYFIFDYPLSQAALSRPCVSDPRFAERFEVFLAGVELGNCFSELTDPVSQRDRFVADMESRKSMGKTIFPIDEELISALASVPGVSGIAVGVDRLIMLVADVPTVADTLLFPADELFDLSSGVR